MFAVEPPGQSPFAPAIRPTAAVAAVKPAEAGGEAGAQGDLTKEQQRVVQDLRARDREVRDHEEAHARVGGEYAGLPSYTYQEGPDGKQYAVGGEVPIDVAPVDGDPEATIEKMEVVKAAALAPAEPSGQDRKVAALADAQRIAALAELATQRREEQTASTSPEKSDFAAGFAQLTPLPETTVDELR